MSCPAWGGLADGTRANTGRDCHLPEQAFELRRYEIDSREDIRECRKCKSLFLWIDDSSWTGSGNNDEEILKRIPEDRVPLVRSHLRAKKRRLALEAARGTTR